MGRCGSTGCGDERTVLKAYPEVSGGTVVVKIIRGDGLKDKRVLRSLEVASEFRSQRSHHAAGSAYGEIQIAVKIRVFKLKSAFIIDEFITFHGQGLL